MNFKGYFRKKAIALKRNFFTVPFIVNVITLVVVSCSLYVHSQVASRVAIPGEDVGFMKTIKELNALFLFLTMLFAILGTVAYLKYMGKIKNYIMLAVYYVMYIGQIVLEVLFFLTVSNRYAFETGPESPQGDLIVQKFIALESNSMFLCILHIILVVLALILASFAPLIQKKLKQIKFSKISDN